MGSIGNSITKGISSLTKPLGNLTGSNQQLEAAQGAAQTQAASSQAAIDEQRRQFDAVIKMMSPYVAAGTSAIGQQQNLLGLSGSDAQQNALQQLQQSPLFSSMMQQGQNALLQNASATGGLRGGNTQAALAQFAPNILANIYQQQLSNLGGIAGLGQASAGLQAAQGQASSANIGNLLQQQGAALAGGQIAGGSGQRQLFSDALSIVGAGRGMGAF